MTTSKARRKAKGRYVIGFPRLDFITVLGHDYFNRKFDAGHCESMSKAEASQNLKKTGFNGAAIFRLVRVRSKPKSGGKSK